jgi:beta-xylosidase
MRQFLIYFSLVSAAAIALLQSSCTPGSCFEETNAYVKATFYLTSTSKTFAPDSLTLYGVGIDKSLIYDKSGKVRQAMMPLDASTDECGFVIRINGVNDTISFSYSTYNHLISKECGYTFYHTINQPSFTRNIIDTVTIVKNTITTLSEENIRIYY